MENELNDLIQGFVEESHEAFEAIENDLLLIESNPEDTHIVNGIFRVLHTIKGTAGFMGLDDIGKLSHKLESIFDMIRRKELSMSSEMLDVLLPAIDLLKLMVFELIEETKSAYSLDETFETLEQIIQNKEITGTSPDAQLPGKTKAAEEKISEKPPVEEDSKSVSYDLAKEFVLEAEEHLEEIEQNLLKLEKNTADGEAIKEIFRGIHSIKGTASYVNLTKIIELTHVMETLFDKLRKGPKKYVNEMADVVLKAVDLLRTLVFMVKMGEDLNIIDIKDVIAQLKVFLNEDHQSTVEPVKKEEPAAQSSGSNKLDAFKNVSSQQSETIIHLGSLLVDKLIPEDELTMLHRSLNTLSKSAGKVGLNAVSSMSHDLADMVLSLLSLEKNHEEVKSQFASHLSRLLSELNQLEENQEDIVTAPVADETAKPTQAEAPAKKAPPQNAVDVKGANKAVTPIDTELKTMRVESHRLDTFMNLIGELIIVRNSFNHALGEIAGKKQAQEFIASLRGVENAFSRISEDLQTTLMDMRLIPVKTVFQKIPRIIRDIARKTNKQIQLQLVGENTQIDKSIIEVIGDPLVHIIRNCCDHGIESADERRKAGKPETGNIILKASHLGSVIAIDIIDDGAGINTERVLKKALDLGLVTPDQAETLDNKTINKFIFHPGFSTAKQVSDISGRGVGMDVVMTNINKVHGTVEVDSEVGSGTQVRLLLPLTLAVIDALLIIDGKQKYAVPLESVKESIEVRESELQLLNQKEAINLRGNIIGVSRLAGLLGLQEKEPDPDRVVSIVFVQVAKRVMGLVVDDLWNQQEIVVKPLQSYLARIPGIGGSTILGSGEIILILEPTELIDLAIQ
ncbi:MAG: chemotaxis protein CheA [Deltaproteobacteria bacterium]|nr:chemotaxis protein CheA [Deltaproteobacteria bacterium]